MTVPLTLPPVPFWRALAVKVAPSLTVPPAVVALVGPSAVVARAGVVVPVPPAVDAGGVGVGVTAGSGAVADHKKVTALDAP
jgi:hypothetical protein